MSSLYAMRRANGDWFAFEEPGGFRVPVFSSERGGMLARASHWGMQLFKPVAIDGRALGEMVPADGSGGTVFWLVDDPFTNVNRGRPIARARLSLIASGAA